MMKIKTQVLKNIFSLVVIAVIVILLFSRVNVFETVSAIKKINLRFFLVAVLISIVFNLFVGTDRLRRILNTLGCKIAFREILFIRMGSSPLRILSSIRADSLLQSAYLKKHKNFPFSSGMTAVVFALILNIFALLPFIAFGLLFCIFWKKLDVINATKDTLLIAIIACISLFICFLATKSKRLQNITLNCLSNINKEFGKALLKFISMYNRINYKKFIYLWLYSIIFQFSELVVCYFLTKSLNLHIPFYLIVLFVPIVILISNLPITFAGIGVRECSILLLFSEYGTAEKLLALGMMYSFVEHIIPILIGFLFITPFLKKFF